MDISNYTEVRAELDIVIDKIKTEMISLNKNILKSPDVKKANKRVRKNTSNLQVLGKQFRKLSGAHDKLKPK